MMKIDNPKDIEGKQFGKYKVKEYLGIKYHGSKLNYQYRCALSCCGRETTAERYYITHRNTGTMCKECQIKAAREKRDIESFKNNLPGWKEKSRMNGRANKNNLSTGIKHYYISPVKNSFIHRVQFKIDNRKYLLASTCCKADKPIPEIIDRVNTANKFLVENGKETFKVKYAEYLQ